jgi:cation diffusion facilitator family transporter
MIIEITAGIIFGSMALLADGLHMGSHTVALGVSVFAYVYARHNAGDKKFSFGTGKANSLAAYSSAILLGAFAAVMAFECIERFINPINIDFNKALIVAMLGLTVNGVSVLLLGNKEHHHTEGRDDHNLRSAYLHVLADALTSLFAIIALLCGKYFDANWMDPAMGIIGACLLARWSIGLLKQSSQVLLDKELPASKLVALQAAIEISDVDRVMDLHLWRIGLGIHAAEIILASTSPKTVTEYRLRIPEYLNIVHCVIEVHDEES